MIDHRFEVRITTPSLDVPDGDYTDECVECGTTFTAEAPGMVMESVPVEHAWVKDGVLTMIGHACWGPA